MSTPCNVFDVALAFAVNPGFTITLGGSLIDVTLCCTEMCRYGWHESVTLLVVDSILCCTETCRYWWHESVTLLVVDIILCCTETCRYICNWVAQIS